MRKDQNLRCYQNSSVLRIFMGLICICLPFLIARSALLPACCRPEISSRSEGKNASLSDSESKKKDQEARKLLSEAIQLMKVQESKQACKLLKRSVKLAPDLAEAHHNLGLALAKTSKIEAGIAELRESTRLKPSLTESWISLGGLEQSIGQTKDAIATYQEFLKRFPNHPLFLRIQTLTKNLQAQVDCSTNNSLERASTKADIANWTKADMPLKVFIHPEQENSDTQSKRADSKPDYSKLLRLAFADWAEASDDLLSFHFIKTANNADIECFYEQRSASLDSSSDAGLTSISIDEKNKRKVRVSIVNAPLSDLLPQDQDRLRVICLHEIGHALGLRNHSNDPKDIMFFSIGMQNQKKKLSSNDINRLKLLYSSTRTEKNN